MSTVKLPSRAIKYSIVVPIFNEAATIPELWRQLHLVIQNLDSACEVIFIDDGSKDNSYQLLSQLQQENNEIKILRLSRNFGHQPALTAGIENAAGEAVILMDGDLQDSPQAILRFVERWQQGYDVVYAIREKRKEFWLKRLAFVLFYRLLNFLSGKQLPLDAGIFSLMDRRVVEALCQMPERNRYLSGLRAYAGFKQTGIVVERGSRYHGQPKVTVSKLFKLALDGIFSFSVIPLRIATIFGFVCAICAFILGLVGLYYKLVLKTTFLSWAYGLTTTFFMGGIQLIFLGIIGEYIGRIYDEVKQRPYYIIKDTRGFYQQSARKHEEISF